MYTIIRKSRLNQLESRINDLSEKIAQCREQYAERCRIAEKDIKEMDALIHDLRTENDKLKSVEGETNSVTLTVSDDLTSIVPLVRYHPNISESLIQGHYLTDGNTTSHAIQLALMVIAHEGLEQILEQFGQPIPKEDD